MLTFFTHPKNVTRKLSMVSCYHNSLFIAFDVLRLNAGYFTSFQCLTFPIASCHHVCYRAFIIRSFSFAISWISFFVPPSFVFVLFWHHFSGIWVLLLQHMRRFCVPHLDWHIPIPTPSNTHTHTETHAHCANARANGNAIPRKIYSCKHDGVVKFQQRL